MLACEDDVPGEEAVGHPPETGKREFQGHSKKMSIMRIGMLNDLMLAKGYNFKHSFPK